MNRRTVSAGLAIGTAFAVLPVLPALAETYDFVVGRLGTNGSDADGTIAVSDSGNAQGRCIDGGRSSVA